MAVRLATAADRSALKALWQVCFHESEPFLDWFFDNRFLPEYCVLVTEGDQVLSALHGLPLHARVRDALLPAVLIGGVATLPVARGQGHMHEAFAAFLRAMRGYGAAIAFCRPLDFSTYRKLGMLPCADAQFLSLPADAPRPHASAHARDCDLLAEACALYRCYDRFSSRYSCAISRTYADFRYKCEEYRSDGAQTLAVLEGGEVAAYSVCFDEGDHIYGDECVARSDEGYGALYDALSARFAGRPLRLRLPPDISIDAPEADIQAMPYMAAAALNVPALLGATRLDLPVPIEVTDGVIFENNGVFLPSGRATSAASTLKLSAAHLAQWAVGYRSVSALVESGDAHALNRRAVAALDAAGTRVCHMVEEY